MVALFDRVVGMAAFAEWFGEWPSFHDAEIVQLSMNRQSQSVLKIHVWRTTARTDSSGMLVTDKHAMITLTLDQVTDCEIAGFNHQNVISSLIIQESGAGIRVSFDPTYGAGGWILAEGAAVSFEPTPRDADR